MPYHHQMEELLPGNLFGIVLPIVFNEPFAFDFQHPAHFFENFNSAEQVLRFPGKRHLPIIFLSGSFH